jgi:hypothetical protein
MSKAEKVKKVLAKAGESDVAAAIRRAIGAGPDEEVQVTVPQFQRCPREGLPAQRKAPRSPGDPGPQSAPKDLAGFEALRGLSEDELQALGLRRWGRDEDRGDRGPMLWLFPGEWYEAIPDGFLVIGLSFKQKAFVRGKSDDDIRFGCLPYGIVRVGDVGET